LKHQPVKQGQTTTPGISFPTLSDKCVGSLTSPANRITLKMQETGPTVYCPYPRRPERLTICRCHYKGSTCPEYNLVCSRSNLHAPGLVKTSHVVISRVNPSPYGTAIGGTSLLLIAKTRLSLAISLFEIKFARSWTCKDFS